MTKEDKDLCYRLGFMEYLLQTNPDIAEQFALFTQLFDDAEKAQNALLAEAEKIINDTNNSDS